MDANVVGGVSLLPISCALLYAQNRQTKAPQG
jgi:hypothetical protein